MRDEEQLGVLQIHSFFMQMILLPIMYVEYHTIHEEEAGLTLTLTGMGWAQAR